MATALLTFLHKIDHFRILSASVLKQVFVRNHSYYNESHLRVYFHVNKTNFQKKTFARGLVLKQRHEATRKWPIATLV